MVPKRRFRQEALAARREIGPEERALKSEAVSGRIMSLHLLRPGATVCFYLATPDEVETRPLVVEALEAGCRVLLPKVAEGGNLELYPVEDLSSQLEAGPFRIEEPIGGSAEPVNPGSVDCFIVPGVGFDTSGRRCGFGRGYFDRLLASRASGALVVALAFECQITSALPADDHDVLMDIICTEEMIYDCRSQAAGLQVEPQRRG
jgi:5-formyltetrahydrofolate cyclo-ligase